MKQESFFSSLTPRDLLLILVLGMINLLSNFHRVSLGVMGDYLTRDFALTEVQLGAMGSAIFSPMSWLQPPERMSSTLPGNASTSLP